MQVRLFSRHSQQIFYALLFSMSIFSTSSVLAVPAISSNIAPSVEPQAIHKTLSDGARLYDEVWKLVNVRFVDGAKNGQDWQIWRHRYDENIETEKDATVAIRSMLLSLNDVYTRYLNTEEFSDETNSIKATLKGIGIQIGIQNDRVVVVAPIEDTPAMKAGLKSGDILIEINGKSTQGMTVKDAADLIRGEVGTPVKLLVQTGKTAPPKQFEITRAEFNIKSVSEVPPLPLKPNVGYIRLSSFLSEKAGDEFQKALSDESDKAGYIVDLRSNPGGLLKNAIQISNMFLPSGAIVSTVDRDGYKETVWSQPISPTSKPLVLLIDAGSASASEILSGALRDNKRALLVGKKSFGKGLVQEINALPLGAGVNITTQKYLTPNDTDINKLGIIPDIDVSMPTLKDDKPYDAKRDGDPQLMAAQGALEDLIAGKDLNYLKNRSLVESTPAIITPQADTIKPKTGSNSSDSVLPEIRKLKTPLKIR